MICTLIHIVSVAYLVPLHPDCQLPPSPLLAQEGWRTVAQDFRISACGKVGTLPCQRAALWGMDFGSTFSTLLFPTLTVLEILLAVVWRTLAMWRGSIMVTVGCIFTALHWSSTRAYHRSCPHTLFSFSNIKPYHLPISYTAKELPRPILYGGPLCKYTSLASFLLMKPLSVSYTEQFDYSQNLPCDDLLLTPGRHQRCEVTWPPLPSLLPMAPGLVLAAPRAGAVVAVGSHPCWSGLWGW